MKNIVLLTPGFPESNEDTTCIPALQALVLELKKLYGDEINLQVVTFQYPFKKGNYLWNSIPCFSAGGANSKFPSRWKTWTTVLKFLRNYHQNYPIDVIHAFWLNECSLVGNWIAAFTGAKLICHVMGQDSLASNKYLKYLKLKNAVIVATSPFSISLLEQNSNIKVDALIPFGINPDDFSSLKSNEFRETDILGVGSLSTVKNYKLFIEIFANLRKEFPKLTGKIIGDGAKRQELQSLINDHKLQKSLVLTGKLPRASVLNEMQKSKILMHTSSHESGGYVFLEALYSGMKVVCFKVGLLPEVQGAYPCSNEKEFYSNMKSLLTYKQVYSGKAVPLIADSAKAVFDLYKSA